MIKNFFKKNKAEKEEYTKDAKANSSSKISEKSDLVVKFFSEKFEATKREIFIIRSKCKNLRETNYNLGLKHLEDGNLGEAIFRFRFTKKFWPDLFDAYYQLAYCLVLNKEMNKAKEVLAELLSKKPDYDDKAQELLKRIDSSLNQET